MWFQLKTLLTSILLLLALCFGANAKQAQHENWIDIGATVTEVGPGVVAAIKGGEFLGKLDFSKPLAKTQAPSVNPASAGGKAATNTTRRTNANFPTIRSTVSQKQNRHIEGRPEYRGGGTLSSQADAQRVLDAYHGSNVEILGSTSQGFPVVRFNGVTGTNNNVRMGITNQPTNVFIIKGTASPSVVPANPNWTP